MKIYWPLIALTLTFGCIEGPGERRGLGDEDAPRSEQVDLSEFDEPDLDDGRGDVGSVDAGTAEENPSPNGRDVPPPDLPEAGVEEDVGHDESGRTAEDIANQRDVG